MKVRKIFTAVGAVYLAAVALAGCRSEEQGRLTNYEPGVYKGKPDTELTEDQRRELMRRALMQSGSTQPAGGGSPTRDVRKPIDSGALNERTRNQKGS